MSRHTVLIKSAMDLNLSPLKEPLGFIKVLEWIFSIFSFATTGGYGDSTHLNVTCQNDTMNRTVEASFGYPFRLYQSTFKGIEEGFCRKTWSELHLTGDYSSPAQFYVTIAVLAFLYCLGALVLYLGYKRLYDSNSKFPLIDFVITAIFAFMWLVSSSAWAKGLGDVKTATNPSIVSTSCKPEFKCTGGEGPHMKSLNISVVFGFLNLILWAGNAWFVYKETSLHRGPASDTQQGPDNIPPP